MEKKSSKPKAVLISDLHFTVNTLELASSALQQALDHSLELGVPLIIAGDTLDGKAIVRAECANRLIAILSRDVSIRPDVYLLIGNHDRINEKSPEHALEFLRPYCTVVDGPAHYSSLMNLWMIPYTPDPVELGKVLGRYVADSGCRTIIMHTGVQTANMGHYIKDSSSLPKETFKDYRVISGHYHMAQAIKCGSPKKGGIGLFSYIGNPYTLNYGEANDGPKGFRVLHEDGTLKSIPTNLRKHIVVERDIERILDPIPNYQPGDLLQLKVTGPRSLLDGINKAALGRMLIGHYNFKLDKIVTESDYDKPLETKEYSNSEMLDNIIDQTSETIEQKAFLKQLWREVLDV